MGPVITEVERQIGRRFERLEVWHHPENRARMRQVADVLRNACGGMIGVPAFFNEATGEALCGEQEFDTLLLWTQKKPAKGASEK